MLILINVLLYDLPRKRKPKLPAHHSYPWLHQSFYTYQSCSGPHEAMKHTRPQELVSSHIWGFHK